MVELRWFVRQAKVPPEFNVGYPPKYPMETVLQYRTKKPDSTLGWMPADPRDLWNDWQDVPTQKEAR